MDRCLLRTSRPGTGRYAANVKQGMRLSVLAALLVISLTACPGSRNAPQGQATPKVVPGAPELSCNLARTPVTLRPGYASDPRVVPWACAEIVDERTVLLSPNGLGSCLPHDDDLGDDVIQQVDVRYERSRILATILVGTRYSSTNSICAGVGISPTVRIRLREDIGKRQIVDGASLPQIVRLTPDPLSNTVPIRWSDLKVKKGRELAISYLDTEGCSLDRIEILFSYVSRRIRVTLFAAPVERECGLGGVGRELTFKLREDLRGREIVEGSSGEQVTSRSGGTPYPT